MEQWGCELAPIWIPAVATGRFDHQAIALGSDLLNKTHMYSCEIILYTWDFDLATYSITLQSPCCIVWISVHATTQLIVKGNGPFSMYSTVSYAASILWYFACVLPCTVSVKRHVFMEMKSCTCLAVFCSCFQLRDSFVLRAFKEGIRTCKCLWVRLLSLRTLWISVILSHLVSNYLLQCAHQSIQMN